MLVGLHGMQAGLSSERTYTSKILPCGVLRGLTDALIHHDLSGLARALAIGVGLVVTTTGYCVGRAFSRLTASRNSLATEDNLRSGSKLPSTDKVPV